MSKPRLVIVLSWVGFVGSFSMAILFFALPGLTAQYAAASLNLPSPSVDFNPFIPRMVAILLVPVGLAYLLAALNPAAARPLLTVATSEKCLFVLYAFAALASGTVNNAILAGVILDGILAVAGIYAVATMREPKK